MANKHSSKDKHKKKHKEKSKKHRKEKKHKHKKEKSKHKSDSSDSENSDSEESTVEEFSQDSSKNPEWGFLDTVLSDSNVSVKGKKEKKRPSPERPGQNIRELNPYWKDGGCGLPPTEVKSKFENVESTSGVSLSESSSSWRNYSDRKNLGKEFERSDKSKPNFLKPGEQSSFGLNKNTFQRNWKKKESQKSENEEPEPREACSNSEKVESTSKKLSNEELNKLASKLVKAEIMGNTALVSKLKSELEAAKQAKAGAEAESSKQKTKEVVIVTDRGLKKSCDKKQNYVPSKRQKVNTHDATGRVCYFPDDDKYSLKNLFEKEKGAQEEDLLLPSKLNVQNLDELDDVYLDVAASNKMQEKLEGKKIERAKKEAVVKHRTLEGCRWCLDNRNDTKHLIVSTGNKCYLCLPEEESLTKGHCLIVPLQHEISAMHLDEDVWSEIKTYQRVLTKMFLQEEQDVVFFENARSFKIFPHCVIHCVPLEKEMGDVAPIYFQKAISESESEWANNKKVIDFRQKDLRRSIPKGLPYFAVSFGNEGGFAHIIEDEFLFKKNFAEEVLGGMLDLDPRRWRKPQKENFRNQREKALNFLKIWKKFEFNEHVPDTDSDSSSSD